MQSILLALSLLSLVIAKRLLPAYKAREALSV